MAWVFLIFAGLFEIVWAYSMKLSEGFSKLTPSIITIVFMILSFGLLAYAIAARDRVYHLDRNWCNWIFLGGDFYFR